jgi:Rieske Fe-S protein
MTDHQGRTGIDRRHVIAGGLAAAGVAGLAACGDGATGSTDDPLYGGGQQGAATTAPTSTAATTEASTATSTGSAAAGTALIALADVPVGGAASAKDSDGKPLIVAQPQAGTVVAFSAICTHQGCTVAPAGAQIKCPCHGSVFALADGARVSGQAQRPLAKVDVTVADGQVFPA